MLHKVHHNIDLIHVAAYHYFLQWLNKLVKVRQVKKKKVNIWLRNTNKKKELHKNTFLQSSAIIIIFLDKNTLVDYKQREIFLV